MNIKPVMSSPPPGMYQHYKGGRYTVIGVAADANNANPRVSPQVVYVGDDGRMWHRSVEEFTARFVLVEESP